MGRRTVGYRGNDQLGGHHLSLHGFSTNVNPTATRLSKAYAPSTTYVDGAFFWFFTDLWEGINAHESAEAMKRSAGLCSTVYSGTIRTDFGS